MRGWGISVQDEASCDAVGVRRMVTVLGQERLKSGEEMEIGVVETPDAEWLPRVVPFLGHKPPEYCRHIREALEGPLDALQTRFYLGLVEGKVITEMMTVGDGRVAILGHVFTLPEERRKGACALLMRHQMEHSRQVGYEALCLGTGYDTPPYWIYHSFGFRGVGPGNGCMTWLRETDTEARLYRERPASIRPLRWEDWGQIDLLILQPLHPGEELPRSPTFGIKTQSSAEGPFLELQLRRRREPAIQARALVTQDGIVVGWAFLAPDPRWFRDAWLADVRTHPAFHTQLPALLASLEFPDAPVYTMLTAPAGPRAAVFAESGFRRLAALPDWLVREGERETLHLWVREGPGIGKGG